MAVKILQYNCQRSYSVTVDLGARLCESNSNFALVQEPYAIAGGIRGLPGFMKVFPCARANSAVIVNDVNVECMTLSATDFGVCVAVEGDFGRLILVSIYCKFSQPIEPFIDYLESLLPIVGNTPLIVGMDANASSPLWFSKRFGYRSPGVTKGVLLSEWLVNLRMNVINEPSEYYTFDGPRGRSDIDVSIVNDSAMRTFQFRWNVCPEGVSDHNLIKIVATYVPQNRVREITHNWNRKNIDWTMYGECVKMNAYMIPINEFKEISVDEQIAFLNEWVGNANDIFLGRSRKTNSRRTVWWNDQLSVKRAEVRRLRKYFQKARNRGAYDTRVRHEQYRRSEREYKSMIMNAKETEWREFISQNRDDPWGKVYRVCRGKRRQTDICALHSGDNRLNNWKDCVNVLLNEFFPREDRPTVSHNSESSDPPPLNESEIAICMNLVKARKSPGLDGLTGQMCKTIWKLIPEYLGAVYAKCVNESYFPREWKMAKVVVFLKSPDRPRSNPRSYRGICLLPVLGKVLERIMVQRLQESMNDDGCEFQYGFKKGKSTEDAWIYVKNSVNESNSKYVLGLFVDFKGAFDYLSWASVLNKLEELGCPEYKLWRSYFSDRRACIVGVNETVSLEVARGCPQGSICGPFIWNLMMDTLLRQIGQVCKVAAYADDLLVLVEGQSRSVIEEISERVMCIIGEWSTNVGVDIAVDKTVSMLLKGRLDPHRGPSIRMNGQLIKSVSEVKYLGVYMGERMNFCVHPMKIRDQITSVVGCIRRVLRTDWGLSRRAVRTVYEGLFVACATYGSVVWSDAAKSAVGYKRIMACQRTMLLGSIPVCRTVSTEAIQVLAGAPPLDLEVMRRSIAFRLKRGLVVNESDFLGDRNLEGMNPKERKVILKECLLEKWQNRWENSVNGRVTYKFVTDVRQVYENQNFDFGLSLGYILTGHGSLNAFLQLRYLSETDLCECGMVETWMHVLCECRLYADIRDLNSFGITEENGNLDFSRVLENPDSFRRLGIFATQAFNRRRIQRDRAG